MKGIIFENENEFVQIGTIKQLVAESIKRIVMTNPRERPNNIDFGFGLKTFIFSTQDFLVDQVTAALKETIEREDPRVLVENIIISTVSENKVSIRLKYIIKEFYMEEETLNIEVGV